MPDIDMSVNDHRGANKQLIEETARDVGVTLSDYNPNLSARDAGKIGGRIGGKKGGGITRELIAAGKKSLSEQ